MNIKRLKDLEERFLSEYKDGFESEDMKKIAKKHNLQKNVNNIHIVCSKDNFKEGLNIYDDIVKVVTKSSLVSVFEKMKFRDLVKELDLIERHMLIDAVYELLHGDEQEGFELMVNLLSPYKLAKWPIITVFRAYYYPQNDILIKPTTVKKIIKYLELEDVVYSPKANYAFYNRYRLYLNELKKHVANETLKPNNPAFSGFLMMTIQ